MTLPTRSNYYDDPFDTFIRIDVEKIKNIAQNFKVGNLPPSFIPSFNLIPKQNLSDENFNIMINNVINFAKEARNELRKQIL